MISLTLLLVLFPLLIYWLYKSSKVPKGLTHQKLLSLFILNPDFPPGPGRLPIVGSLLSIPNASGVLVACTQWFIKRYGKLVEESLTQKLSLNVLNQVGFYAGHIPSVACYDYDIAKELFNQDVSAGRPNTFVWMYR